ncbi:hypothetical protein GYA49_04610 [Candidatus Beckwithbacteria bacterium]|nr:hypothetical protein [Candidatus Beckwithbacteria bacterium]
MIKPKLYIPIFLFLVLGSLVKPVFALADLISPGESIYRNDLFNGQSGNYEISTEGYLIGAVVATVVTISFILLLKIRYKQSKKK